MPRRKLATAKQTREVTSIQIESYVQKTHIHYLTPVLRVPLVHRVHHQEFLK